MSEESTPAPTRPSGDRPTRGAECVRGRNDRAPPGGDAHWLPSLDDGVTLLDVEGGRGVPALQSLVLDHLLVHDGPAFWVDADGHATTAPLARIAPGRRLLDRIRIARGFTAAQHYGAVRDLPTAVNRRLRRAADVDAPGRKIDGDCDGLPTPSLVVAPAVDAKYRDDDALGDRRARTLQARALARLATYAEAYDAPVLVTRSEADEFAAPVEAVADHRLACEQTRMGPRFVGDEFETPVYPVDDAYYQTTFAYWRRLLGARAEQVGLEPTAPSRATDTTGVGAGVTAGGERATLAADPLRDAWSGAGGR